MNRLENTSKSLTDFTDIYDYIIVGAGTSGTQALEILTRKPCSVVVIEAQDYQGGRIQSECITDIPEAKNLSWIKENFKKYEEVYIEKGATWIEFQHSYMIRLCKDLGLKLREQCSEGSNFYLDKERSYNDKELMEHPQYGPALRLFVNKIDYLAKLYNEKVLSSSKMDENVKMLIEYDKKTVTEFL